MKCMMQQYAEFHIQFDSLIHVGEKGNVLFSSSNCLTANQSLLDGNMLPIQIASGNDLAAPRICEVN